MARSATDPGCLPTLAALSLALAGFVTGLLGLQFVVLFSLGGLQSVVAVLLMVLGALAVLTSRWLVEAGPKAAVFGSLLAPAMLLVTVGWAAYAVYWSTFGLYMLVAPPVDLLATVLVPASVLPSFRAARASAELRKKAPAGFMDVGRS